MYVLARIPAHSRKEPDQTQTLTLTLTLTLALVLALALALTLTLALIRNITIFSEVRVLVLSQPMGSSSSSSCCCRRPMETYQNPSLL